MNKTKYCVICNTSHKVERHHLFPKVHFGQGVRVHLCNEHHRKLEYVIRQGEGFKNGRRIKKDRQFYIDTTIKFLLAERRLYESKRMERKANQREPE